MNDNDDPVPEMLSRMQARSNAYAKGEVAIPLADSPTLYRLPKCTKVGLMTHTPNKADLLLDIEGDHRVMIELDSNTAETLLNLLEITFQGTRGR